MPTFTMAEASGQGSGAIITVAEVLEQLGLSTQTATSTESAVADWAVKSATGAIVSHLRYDPVQAVRTEYYPRQELSFGSRAAVWEVNENQAYSRYLADASTEDLQVAGIPIREKNAAGANAIQLFVDYDGRAGTRSGSFASSTQYTEGVDFWPNYDGVDSAGNRVCVDGVIKSEGRWPAIPGSVKIVYLSGYTTAELAGTDSVIDASPIREVALSETIRRIHKRFSQMKKRTGFGVGALTSENLGDYSYSADGASLAELTGSKASLLQESVMLLQPFVNMGAMLHS